MLLAHYGVVASQISEVATGSDSGFAESEIVEIRDRGEHRIVSTHELGRGGWAADVNLGGPNLFSAD